MAARRQSGRAAMAGWPDSSATAGKSNPRPAMGGAERSIFHSPLPKMPPASRCSGLLPTTVCSISKTDGGSGQNCPNSMTGTFLTGWNATRRAPMCCGEVSMAWVCCATPTGSGRCFPDRGSPPTVCWASVCSGPGDQAQLWVGTQSQGGAVPRLEPAAVCLEAVFHIQPAGGCPTISSMAC
jgi:hypothetical protein